MFNSRSSLSKNDPSFRWRHEESRTSHGPQAPEPPDVHEPRSELLDSGLFPHKKSLEFFGIQIVGLKTNMCSKASLRLSLHLKKGEYELPGIYGNVKAHFAKDTKVSIYIDLKKTLDKKIVLDQASVQFSTPVHILNPFSSLQKHGSGHTLLSRLFQAVAQKIKDAIADIYISEVKVDDHGHVEVLANLRLAKVKKNQVQKDLASVSLPVLDQKKLESLLLDQGSGQGSSLGAQEILNQLTQKVDLKKFLCTLGAMTQKGQYAIHVEGEESALLFMKDDVRVGTSDKATKIDLEGSFDFSKDGGIHIDLSSQSTMQSSLGTFYPQGDLYVENLGSKKPIDVRLKARLSGEVEDLTGAMLAQNSLGTMFARQRQSSGTLKHPVSSKDKFRVKLGAPKIRVEVDTDINARIDRKKLESVSGSVKASAEAVEPYISSGKSGVQIDGTAKAELLVDHFLFEPKRKIPKAEGSFSYGIYPDARARKMFPGLQPFTQNASFQLYDDGKATLNPDRYGITRFFRPIQNMEGQEHRLVQATNKIPEPIGTQAYFRQMERVTGAKVRLGNQVELLVDGIKSMPKRLELINKAQSSIYFQTLTFKNDESGREIAEALVKAAQRGVKVCGIVDSIGNINSLKELENENPLYRYLIDNGVNLKLYNGATEASLRQIFGIVKAHPDVFTISHPRSFKDLPNFAQFFKELMAIVDNSEETRVSGEEKGELAQAIHELFGGAHGASHHMVFHELESCLKNEMVALSSLLSILKRISYVSYRGHEKYLVVDGQEAIMGGMNIADEYLKGGTGAAINIKNKPQPAWRDTDVFIKGRAAVDVHESFHRNWLYVAKEQLPGIGPMDEMRSLNAEKGVPVQIIQHRPMIDGDHNITNFFIENLKTLQKGEKAWFETAYFLPRGVLKELQAELSLAAKRGVDVRILTNSVTTSDFPNLVKAAHFDERDLIEAGVRVFHRSGQRMLHAKTAVLGNILSVIGSWNTDNRSASHDSEDVAAIYDPKLNEELANVMFEDMSKGQAQEISWKSIKKTSVENELTSMAMGLVGELL